MLRVTAGYIGIALAAGGYLGVVSLHEQNRPAQPVGQQSVAQTSGEARISTVPSDKSAFLREFCIKCHDENQRTAGLTLENITLGNVGERAEIWEKVLVKLKTRTMPPPGMARPDEAAYDAFTSWLEMALNPAEPEPNPGRPGVHRLNRVEYANSIRDLFGLEIDARSMLPADDAGYGFDNIADILSVSPGLLERYMSAAGEISRRVVGDPTIRPSVETYRVPQFRLQADRVSEDLPFSSRGGIAVKHFFPVDGEYILKIRLQRAYGDVIRGLSEPHELEVRLDTAKINSFTVGGKFPDDPALAKDKTRIQQKTEYEQTADAALEVRFQVQAGPRLVGVAFLKRNREFEGALRPALSVTNWAGLPSCGTLWLAEQCEEPGIDSIQIDGPYSAKRPLDSGADRKVFVCRPGSAKDEESCAKTILSTIARRAYRRPLTQSDVQSLLGLYRTGQSKNGFEAGIELAIRGILVSPQFLFRIESDPASVAPGTAYRLNDFELASRLSFFLWSSIPDDELLETAERGQFKDSAVLQRQVRRMLADERSSALVKNFFGQWLYLRNVRSAAADSIAFPEFDDSLREAFQQETELFLGTQLREDNSVLDLLRANYTFVNERLARHYDIPNVYGSHFRRITLKDGRRAGLLGHGSILMVTSYPNRTSPVLRGKWLLENILGTPPPPPPPNVPPLPAQNESGKALSMREMMEQHRKDPACAGCHSQMDPLGFALENFDAVGKWRSTENRIPIDASGRFPDGTKFEGPADLRELLLSHREQFVSTLTEKLLTYAVGRGLQQYDAPVVRKIAKDAAADDYRWSLLIMGIVQSTPFQMTRSRETAIQ